MKVIAALELNYGKELDNVRSPGEGAQSADGRFIDEMETCYLSRVVRRDIYGEDSDNEDSIRMLPII